MSASKIACFVAFIIGAAIGFTWGADDTAQDIEARRDHFRIVGEVEFEGERISYNEIIQVRIKLGTISTMGLKKGDNRSGMSRLWIARTLKGAGALLMEVPDGGGLFTDLERVDQPREPHRTQEQINQYLRPPPEFLPVFFWVDHVTRPSAMEAYVSEAYYKQPNARLRIVQPIRIEFVPPTKEADEIAWAQAHAEPHVNVYEPGEMNDAWNGFRLLKVSRHEWTQWPDVAPVIANALEGEDNTIPRHVEELIFRSARRVLHWGSGSYERHGVPQSQFANNGWGMLYRASASLRADATIPVACDWTTMMCALAEGQGYHILSKRRLNQSGIKITLAGRLFDLRLGMVAIDQNTSDIFLVGLATP
jgi:hypothetical protein